MIKVTIGDEYPQLICEECFELLKKIILFRRTCVESEEKLYQAYQEDPNIDILEQKPDTSIYNPDTSSPLQPKIEAINELPNGTDQETLIKTEEECLPLKTESDDGNNAADSDPDYNNFSNNDDSDSDYEPLINIKNKIHKIVPTTNKIKKAHYYECEFKCGRTIGPHFGHYEKHLKRHKPKLNRCPSCPRKMYSQIFFQKHLNEHAELTCTQCQKLFLQQKEFDKHLLTHGVLRPYICSICDGTFQTKFVSIYI